MLTVSLYSSNTFMSKIDLQYRARAIGKMAPSIMQMWTRSGSTLATFMFIWSFVLPYIPRELRQFLERYRYALMAYFYPYIRVNIHEYPKDRFQRSKIFADVESYLSDKSFTTAKCLKAEGGKKLVLTIDESEKVTDEYEGVQVSWVCIKIPPPKTSSVSYYPRPEKRIYSLTFHKRDRKLITESYLEHVMKKGAEIRAKNRQRQLYTNTSGCWTSVLFEHPATFETVAMDAEKKQEIIQDLVSFSESKEYYAEIGKAWKRGYLLYGPSGTGKSTLIAAIANLLNYSIYDLELTAVGDNTELRKLLMQTTSKSVVVIEDIDCSLDLTGQRNNKEKDVSDEIEKEIKKAVPGIKAKEGAGLSSKVTLSGLLNFIDGLWSASGGERIVVFTTNHVDKLDPALIRAGRMDKHIELSYCSFEGFKVLVKNYMRVEAHPLFDQFEKLLEETKISPANVAESLMPKSPGEDVGNRLRKLIHFLEEAKSAEILKKTKEEEELKNKEQEALVKDVAAEMMAESNPE